eukprot:TRINITY_DN10956_c0_g1_i1.p1 TRINITY_DN10956_c0_g1~~TRINITY_DN10956_c0_g1_i1.p1  ORF type:complete len:155 (-),score=12.12 TRINITY_DN10956_c0_g1_i1:93-557(-)
MTKGSTLISVLLFLSLLIVQGCKCDCCSSSCNNITSELGCSNSSLKWSKDNWMYDFGCNKLTYSIQDFNTGIIVRGVLYTCDKSMTPQAGGVIAVAAILGVVLIIIAGVMFIQWKIKQKIESEKQKLFTKQSKVSHTTVKTKGDTDEPETPGKV